MTSSTDDVEKSEYPNNLVWFTGAGIQSEIANIANWDDFVQGLLPPVFDLKEFTQDDINHAVNQL